MAIMVVCGVLVLAGVVAVVAWGGLSVEAPEPEPTSPPPTAAEFALRYLWYLTVATASGVGAGLLAAGAGGRLAMRLLAATAGDAAQGRSTEADEIVGRISVDGTIGFIVFTALFFGFASGLIYLLIRRWLPRGRLGGLTYGLLLLVLAATRLEPLRADNPDFDIVGPAWVSLTVFGSLVVLHGMVVAALAGRYSRVLPLVSGDRRSLVPYSPLLMLAPAAAVIPILAIVGAVIFGLTKVPGVVGMVRSERAQLLGRVGLAVAALAALPGAVGAFADIAGRGPH